MLSTYVRTYEYKGRYYGEVTAKLRGGYGGVGVQTAGITGSARTGSGSLKAILGQVTARVRRARPDIPDPLQRVFDDNDP